MGGTHDHPGLEATGGRIETFAGASNRSRRGCILFTWKASPMAAGFWSKWHTTSPWQS